MRARLREGAIESAIERAIERAIEKGARDAIEKGARDAIKSECSRLACKRDVLTRSVALPKLLKKN